MENNFIIQNLLQQNKGVRLEFKLQPNIEAIAKVITGFINTHGGDLIVGIEDRVKKVVGVENAQQHAQEIKKALVEQIIPAAPVAVEVVNYKNKDLILISVWEGAKKPYQYRGTIFNRVGSSTKITSVDKLSSLINQRKQADFHWERMPVLGAELEDLDSAEIEKTLKLYRNYKTNVTIQDTEDFLIQLGLIRDGNITNACMVLFGKNPVQFIPQSRIRLTLYPSKVSGNYFLDDKIFEGNIFKNVNSVFDFLEVTFGKTSSVRNVLRTDKFNYPVVAIREGILNAIVHRDYNSVKGFLQISIFSDRTEISNFGGLPKGITIKDLVVEHSSILRNPDMAQVCFIRQYIEMLGGGTLRMINDCKQNKFKAPVWVEKDNVTKVTFPGLSHNRKGEGITKGITEGISKGVVAKVEGVIEGVIEGVTDDVKDKIKKILLVIYKEEGVKTGDIAKTAEIPAKSVERYVGQLKEAGLIEFKGAPRTGGYFLTKKTENKLKK